MKKIKFLAKYITSSLLFLVAFILDILVHISLLPSNLLLYVVLPLSLLGYLILAIDLFIDLIEEFKEKNIFNEVFLTFIASISAFALGLYVEALAVILFFSIGEEFEHHAKHKSEKEIKSLLSLEVKTATKIIDNKEEIVDINDIKKDDILLIRAGEKIPVDGVIIEGSTYINTAFLTGESLKNPAEPGYNVLSGSINEDSLIKIRATKDANNSTLNKLIALIENAKNKRSKGEKFIRVFAKYYTPIVIALAFILAILPPLFLGYNDFNIWKTYIQISATLLVVSCPCALVVSIPLANFISIGKASQYKAIIKGSEYLDKLNSLDVVFLDKTGTITKGNFEITNIHPLGISEENLLELASAGEFYSLHPIAKAIKNKNIQIDSENITSYKEIKGKGITLEYKNKPLLIGNSSYLKENNIVFEEIDTPFSIIYVVYENKYVGFIEISDEIKEDSLNAIKNIQKENIKVIMLSGDNSKVAKKISDLVGCDEYYSELLPEEKADIVKKYKNDNKVVAFIGDGINDALSLLESDIGISMGALGSDVAIETSDIVLMDDKVSSLLILRKIAKKNRNIIIFNIFFAIGVKLAVIILSIISGITYIPFVSDYIMWFGIISDVGVLILSVLNSFRIFRIKSKK